MPHCRVLHFIVERASQKIGKIALFSEQCVKHGLIRSITVHPRTCGEHCHKSTMIRCVSGSSPRVQGTLPALLSPNSNSLIVVTANSFEQIGVHKLDPCDIFQVYSPLITPIYLVACIPSH